MFTLPSPRLRAERRAIDKIVKKHHLLGKADANWFWSTLREYEARLFTLKKFAANGQMTKARAERDRLLGSKASRRAAVIRALTLREADLASLAATGQLTRKQVEEIADQFLRGKEISAQARLLFKTKQDGMPRPIWSPGVAFNAAHRIIEDILEAYDHPSDGSERGVRCYGEHRNLARFQIAADHL